MKIRLDFVTNSSSSNFVIAYKKLDLFDEEIKNKYPFLGDMQQLLENILSTETKDCDDFFKFETRESFEEYLKEMYGRDLEEIFDRCYFERDRYNEFCKYLDKGYKIVMQDYDNHYNKNEALFSIIKKIQSDDFIILELYEE